MRERVLCAMTLAIGVALSGCATTGGGDEKATLSSSAKPEVKAAIASAETANVAAAKAGFEWYMNGKSMSDNLQDAIKSANNGDDAKALKLAKMVELSGMEGQKQAELAKAAGPHFAPAAKPAAQAAAKGDGKAQKSVVASSKQEKPTATTEKPAATAEKPATQAKVAAGGGSGSKVYRASCSACHDSGVAGAPKLGDKAAWGSRIAAGNLHANALNGKGAMPAKGGNASLSDADVKAAVDYMVSQSK
ncbi:MAG TPA: c-type cytochrome [Candidatus Thiothrix moscowensis]|uniref:c-type cytochrome n=1 Tax=unclassified Thiothrix TaxID=2636184 RepID=UPI0025FA63C3|nr:MULTISPECIES: c-type cytochrome [unclassified Thiothrix]HRJ52774.1 c-type cytochrome [Candidatus Thiothrix moscowensis]HRJ92742.1 c-type cytochrome [Candidatus Thiothrix moscowensis]